MTEDGPVPTLQRSPPRKETARLDVTLAGTSGEYPRRLVLWPSVALARFGAGCGAGWLWRPSDARAPLDRPP